MQVVGGSQLVCADRLRRGQRATVAPPAGRPSSDRWATNGRPMAGNR
jgi:hypothetical protein